jgi:hypothetical protein
MVADAPLALYNHFFIMLFTAPHSALQEPHYFIAAIFPLFHFDTSDFSFVTLVIVWKGLKQAMHNETLYLSHTTTLLLFFSSLDGANQWQKLQQGQPASGMIG